MPNGEYRRKILSVKARTFSTSLVKVTASLAVDSQEIFTQNIHQEVLSNLSRSTVASLKSITPSETIDNRLVATQACPDTPQYLSSGKGGVEHSLREIAGDTLSAHVQKTKHQVKWVGIFLCQSFNASVSGLSPRSTGQVGNAEWGPRLVTARPLTKDPCYRLLALTKEVSLKPPCSDTASTRPLQSIARPALMHRRHTAIRKHGRPAAWDLVRETGKFRLGCMRSLSCFGYRLCGADMGQGLMWAPDMGNRGRWESGVSTSNWPTANAGRPWYTMHLCQTWCRRNRRIPNGSLGEEHLFHL